MQSTYVTERRSMVRDQLAHRGIDDADVLRAMMSVPREAFVPPTLVDHAYDDDALPIGEEQTISQPWVVARMAEAARLTWGDRVLEVGTGSGYAAAVYAQLASMVYTVERNEKLHHHAMAVLEGLDYDNVQCVLGDGTLGLVNAAPFDAILVSAADDAPPDALVEQLAVGGRLVAPIGPPEQQRLVRIERIAIDRYTRDELEEVHFVPLLHGLP
jgi:protein-L-isoaspartate(D-aspartate) O-methyltransferase